jgi:lipopolysaccharide/colanic/teichoic acid biosynthesis glycosyltransferase
MADGASPLFWRIKRLWDIGLSIILLPVLLVVSGVVALANLRYNPGPLFYTQLRIGQGSVPFAIYKLRTMTGDASSPRFATEEGQRITPFGQFLRGKRIDELPQIINILKGEMSFIGPRPEQPAFAKQYSERIENYDLRHSVRPGLSGLAQVELGYTASDISAARKLKYDLSYIRNSGFWMEAYIVRRTIVTIITEFGAV